VRGDLLIELAAARRNAGDVFGAHAALADAVMLAEAIGDDDMAARAGALFGLVAPWGSRQYGQHDPAMTAALEALVERLGDRDPAMRVRLLAALGCELYYSDRRPDGERYADEAIAVARGLDDAELLGMALVNRWQASDFACRATAGRVATIETLSLVDHGLSKRTELTARVHHLGELACLGDLAGYDVELARSRALAADLHSAEIDGQLGWADASRSLFAARWDEAEQLATDANDAMVRTSAPGTEWSRVAGVITIARGRGRLGEVVDELFEMCDTRPEFAMFRPAVVLGHAEAGRLDRAHELIERWPAVSADDWAWMVSAAYWAAVAALLGAPDPERAYVDLLPYSGEVAVAGCALDCGGAVDALLAGLCEQLGRTDEAIRLARSALALEQASGMAAWIPRTTALVTRLEEAQVEPQ
jgi:hypothetical protein